MSRENVEIADDVIEAFERSGMRDRSIEQARAQQGAFDDYVRETAAGGPATEIAKAKELLDKGAITQQEFDAISAKAMA